MITAKIVEKITRLGHNVTARKKTTDTSRTKYWLLRTDPTPYTMQIK